MRADANTWLRSPRAIALLAAALLLSLVLGVAVLAVGIDDTSVADRPARAMTDRQASEQAVQAARHVVAVAGLSAASGGYRFVSCRDESGPPYQAAVYLTFRQPQGNSVRYLRELAAALVADGWSEASVPAQHFGRKLTRDGVTAIVYREVGDTEFATLRLYSECGTMSDHRNDDPAWTEITGLQR